ncbi:hypothetical protein ACFWIO_19165 [Streptomyces diastatochromogenes]|uniref:DUF6197 family protein n=1 Tax=Streptomyces diastatochromogenes TaxID=42236 RepID=UPI003648292B
MNAAPTETKAAAPVELDLDARLAEVGAIMTARLDQAGLTVDVNSAHIATDPLPEITIPQLPQTAIPASYGTPIADLLHRAQARLQADGWSREAAVDQEGRRCPIGAIRREAASRWQADDACVLLLEAIQRHWQTETIPSWNAQQTSVAPVLLAFERAAELAHHRGL